MKSNVIYEGSYPDGIYADITYACGCVSRHWYNGLSQQEKSVLERKAQFPCEKCSKKKPEGDE